MIIKELDLRALLIVLQNTILREFGAGYVEFDDTGGPALSG